MIETIYYLILSMILIAVLYKEPPYL